MSKVLYPGSFDPITKGHINIINQASDLFDEVVIAILVNPSKKLSMFSIDECKAIIRGLRGLSDYDYEIQLAQINKDISNNKINTICLFADKEYQFISSSMVKEVFNLGKNIDKYVDPIVKEKMLELRK